MYANDPILTKPLPYLEGQTETAGQSERKQRTQLLIRRSVVCVFDGKCG